MPYLKICSFCKRGYIMGLPDQTFSLPFITKDEGYELIERLLDFNLINRLEGIRLIMEILDSSLYDPVERQATMWRHIKSHIRYSDLLQNVSPN